MAGASQVYIGGYVGGVRHNLCCAPCMRLSPGRFCCGAPPGGCPPEWRPPAGPEWERAMQSGVPRLLLDEALAITRREPATCGGVCAPNHHVMRVTLNNTWLPRANAALAPFGMFARVDAWEEAPADGSPGVAPFLMIVFVRGDPRELAMHAAAASGAVMTAAAATGADKW